MRTARRRHRFDARTSSRSCLARRTCSRSGGRSRRLRASPPTGSSATLAPQMRGELANVEGVLLDMDGVLTVSWHPIPGAADAVSWLRTNEIPFRLITNTTMLSRTRLAAILREGGFDVDREEVLSAAAATGAHPRGRRARARCA